MDEKTLTLRKLCADDMFSMMRLLSKIGVQDIKRCFVVAAAKNALKGGEDVEGVGMNVALELACLLLEKLPDCKSEIYALLADLSGTKAEEIAALDMGTFTNAVLDLVTAEDFRDFFTAVMKRFKREK